MAGFQFRMQSIETLRRRERDQAAAELQKAMQAIHKIDENIAALRDSFTAETHAQAELARQGNLKPTRVLESQRYQLHIQQEISQCQSQRDLILAECEKRRQVLVECEKKVRSLEKLREQQLQEWETEQLKAEQINLDQWAGYQYWSSANQDTPANSGQQE